MSMFNLPSVRIPLLESTDVPSDDEYINESLIYYIKQLKQPDTESYKKLNTVCNMNESIFFYKYLELFQTFSFQREGIKICYVGGEDNNAQKALTLLRGKLDQHENVLVEDGDLVIASLHSSTYEVVQEVLRKQKKGGVLILQVADIFDTSTVHLLYLVAACYSAVCIYTPMLYTGQNKYVIASQLSQNIDLTIPPPYKFKPSQLFLTKLVEINTIIGQKRLEQMRFTTTCEYECIIWKSKYLTGLHNMNFDTNSRSYQVQERFKTAHSNTIN